MSILYEFSNDLRTRNVQFPWVDGLDTLKAGTPLDINGAIVNDDTAVGIVAEDVPRNWGRLISPDGNFYANVQVIVAGYVDLAEAEASCGLEYTDALKGKLADIHFIEGEIGSGGGGQPTEKTERTVIIPEQTAEMVTPQIGDPYYPITAEGELPDTFTLSVDGVAETLALDSSVVGGAWVGGNYSVTPTHLVGGEGYELYINEDPPTSATVIGYTETTTYSGAGLPDYTAEDEGKVLTLEEVEGDDTVVVIPEQLYSSGNYLHDVHLDWESGTPQTFSLTVDGETEKVTYDGQRWAAAFAWYAVQFNSKVGEWELLARLGLPVPNTISGFTSSTTYSPVWSSMASPFVVSINNGIASSDRVVYDKTWAEAAEAFGNGAPIIINVFSPNGITRGFGSGIDETNRRLYYFTVPNGTTDINVSRNYLLAERDDGFLHSIPDGGGSSS